MVYCAIFSSIGWHTFITYMPKENKWLAFIGFTLYIAGMIVGQIVEDRLNDKVKELEKKLTIQN